MTNFSISANCTCGSPAEESPALHGGNCKVWALHHNLTDEKPVEILRTFETIIHVGLTTPSAEVDSKATRAKIRKAAKQWAVVNGFTDKLTLVSSGATLGPVESETRLIFSLMGR